MLAIDDIVANVADAQGWSPVRSAETLAAYVAFLARAEAGRPPPSHDVDALWHQHILHTRRYRQDCEALVGRFIDHEPGPRGSALLAECTNPAPVPPDIVRGAVECTPQNPDDPPGVIECTMPYQPPPPAPHLSGRDRPVRLRIVAR